MAEAKCLGMIFFLQIVGKFTFKVFVAHYFCLPAYHRIHFGSI